MNKKSMYSLALVVSLLGLLSLSVKIQHVHAPHLIITIEADGLVFPTSANITTSDNITYTFSADINASIIVQRSNIVIDGDGWTLGGVGFTIMRGFNLTGVSNVTIKNVNVVEFGYAMWLEEASQCVISNNTCTLNEGGIWLVSSTGNTVSGNNVMESVEAIALDSTSYGNSISDNTLAESHYGTYVRNSSGTLISGNNITANTHSGVYIFNSGDNVISRNDITNNWIGIDVAASSNNMLSGNNVTGNNAGIRTGSALVNSVLIKSTSNTILENNIVSNTNGIDAIGILFTTISRNHIAENSQYGLTLDNASNNTISKNNVVNNNLGIFYDGLCNNNIAYHNNFIGNAKHVEISPGDLDTWDNGLEGNHWSDYIGVDSNHDGIGDSWYEIFENNTDHYPLMGTFHGFNTTLGKHVNVVSNSTIHNFQYFNSNTTIRMLVSNITSNQTHGFCRVTIPYEVVAEPFNVTIDGASPTFWNYTLHDNGTHKWIYFEYEHSTKEVIIVPEYQSLAILTLFMLASLLAGVLYRSKHK